GRFTTIGRMVETPAPTTHSRGWDEASLSDPHADAAKAARVNAMFAAIANSYDLNNRVHSLWRDQAWRRKAANLAEITPGRDRVLDVACGTGDLTMALAARRPAEIVGIDFTPEMLDVARRKWTRIDGDRLGWTRPNY